MTAPLETIDRELAERGRVPDPVVSGADEQDRGIALLDGNGEVDVLWAYWLERVAQAHGRCRCHLVDTLTRECVQSGRYVSSVVCPGRRAGGDDVGQGTCAAVYPWRDDAAASDRYHGANPWIDARKQQRSLTPAGAADDAERTGTGVAKQIEPGPQPFQWDAMQMWTGAGRAEVGQREGGEAGIGEGGGVRVVVAPLRAAKHEHATAAGHGRQAQRVLDRPSLDDHDNTLSIRQCVVNSAAHEQTVRMTKGEPVGATAAGMAVGMLVEPIDAANAELLRAASAMTEPSGLTPARWRVLSAVHERSRTVPEIAVRVRMGLTRQAVQRLADTLCADGFAAFDANPRHRRSQLLRVTPAGMGALDEVISRQVAWSNAVGAALTVEDLTYASRVLRDLAAASRASVTTEDHARD